MTLSINVGLRNTPFPTAAIKQAVVAVNSGSTEPAIESMSTDSFVQAWLDLGIRHSESAHCLHQVINEQVMRASRGSVSMFMSPMNWLILLEVSLATT